MARPKKLPAKRVREAVARWNARAAVGAAAGKGPGRWRFARGRMQKRFEFEGFPQAFAWMTEIALVAQAMDHHPDWTQSYRTVDVTLSTHSAGGVTALDLALAERMDQSLKSFVK